MPGPLDDREMARWTAWKQASDAVMDAVSREIAAAADLSAADFAVLTRLVEIGRGSLRQQQLADLLGWERSRLSRQISRMAHRGLVERHESGAARLISATAEGRARVARARPAHARAVRRALLSEAADATGFWSAIERIAADPSAPGGS